MPTNQTAHTVGGSNLFAPFFYTLASLSHEQGIPFNARSTRLIGFTVWPLGNPYNFTWELILTGFLDECLSIMLDLFNESHQKRYLQEKKVIGLKFSFSFMSSRGHLSCFYVLTMVWAGLLK